MHLNTKYSTVIQTALEANFVKLDQPGALNLRKISTLFNVQNKVKQFAQPHIPIANEP